MNGKAKKAGKEAEFKSGPNLIHIRTEKLIRFLRGMNRNYKI